jgi:hypothetical protein
MPDIVVRAWRRQLTRGELAQLENPAPRARRHIRAEMVGCRGVLINATMR